jgi:hypothetical protein
MFPDFSAALYQTVADIMNICLGTLVPLLLALGIRYANKRWNLGIKAEQQAQIENLGRQAVMVASQSISGNSDKKEHAVRSLVADALKVGVKIGSLKAGEIIEAQVNALKRARGAVT